MRKHFIDFIKGNSIWKTAIIVAVLWQILMTGLGGLIQYTTTRTGVFTDNEKIISSVSPLSHTRNWDSGWYVNIIDNGYKSHTTAPPQAAFYPLFPLLVYITKTITFGLVPVKLLVLILNTVFLAFALAAIQKIALHFTRKNSKGAMYAFMAFLAFPTAFFMHAFYTEAMFCALAFWSYALALDRKWLKLGIVLGLLTASRLPSILFVGLAGLEYLRSKDWSLRKAFTSKSVLAFLIAPIGFLTYGLHLYLINGDFLGMFSGYKNTNDWNYQVFNLNIFETLWNHLQHILGVFSGDISLDIHRFVSYILPFAMIVSLAVISTFFIISKDLRRNNHKGIPLAIFGLLSIIMFSLNSNLISVDRYMLPVISFYIFTSIILSRYRFARTLAIPILYISIMTQSFLYILFTNSYFVG